MRGASLFLAIPSVFAAAFASAGVDRTFAQGAAVSVNGVVVSIVRTPSVDGTSARERAVAFSRALARVSEPKALSIRKVGKTAVILNGEERVITITPAEARAHGSEPYDLARRWVRNIRTAAGRPELILEESAIRMPVGSVRKLDVGGARVGQAVAASDRRDVAQLQSVPGGWAVRATGPGTATLSLTVGSTTKAVEVTVQPYALVTPQAISAEVTGPLAVASVVRGAVETAMNLRLKTAPGARVKWTVDEVPAIGAGEAKTIGVRYEAIANDAFPRSGTLPVLVRNVGSEIGRDDLLWYCNDPETLRGVGHLFAADLERGKAARMLYHHVNETSSDLLVRVQIVNDSDEAAVVAVTPGDAEPDKNPVLAGYRAGQAFMRPAAAGSFEIVRMPPRTSFPLALRRLDPKQTVSGLARLSLLSGPKKILVRTDALPPIDLENEWARALRNPAPWREVGPRAILDQYDRAPSVGTIHVYPTPYRQIEGKFEVGGRYRYLRIGEQPIGRSDNEGRLEGNFGVWYAIKAELSNPTSVPADVEVVFEASAGYSGGLFLVDGVYLQTGLLQAGGESRLRKYRLAPGEKKTVDIRTIPLSGSSYPATITLRPVSSMDVVPSAAVGEGKRSR